VIEVRAAASNYWRLAAAFGVAFIALALAVGLGWFRTLDMELGAAAKVASPCWVRTGSEAASLLLAGEVTLLYAAALGLLCAWRGRPLVGAAVVGALLGSVAVEFLLKVTLYQPSPGVVLGSIDAAQCFKVAYPLNSVSSAVVPNTLPSGYAARSAYFGVLLAVIVGVRWPSLRRLAWMALGPILAVLAASRLAIGWHWTTDVAAGLLLGTAMACAVLALADGFRWLGATRPRPDRYR
jgi:membrane-associated phospholipid phosphatase